MIDDILNIAKDEGYGSNKLIAKDFKITPGIFEYFGVDKDSLYLCGVDNIVQGTDIDEICDNLVKDRDKFIEVASDIFRRVDINYDAIFKMRSVNDRKNNVIETYISSEDDIKKFKYPLGLGIFPQKFALTTYINRTGDKSYFVYDGQYLKHLCDLSYSRGSQNDDGSLYMYDPSGGPYIQVGMNLGTISKNLNGISVRAIDSYSTRWGKIAGFDVMNMVINMTY